MADFEDANILTNKKPMLYDVFSSNNLHINARIFDPGKPVLVAFASGGRPREPAGDAMAQKYGINCISVACREMDWFQYPEMPEAEAALRSAVKHFPRVMTYGFSMGAYGALKFSGPLGADVVLAISPQVAIGPTFPASDLRWPNERARIAASFGFPHDDLRERLSRNGDVILIYDPLDPDAEHIRQILAVRPCTVLSFPLSGHFTLPLLARHGLSSRIVRDVIGGAFNPAACQIDIHAARRPVQRVVGLVDALADRGRQIPVGLILKLAALHPPADRATLRRAAVSAASQDLPDALAATVLRLVEIPAAVADPAFLADMKTFAPLIARSHKAGDLLRKLAQLGASASGRKAVPPLIFAATLSASLGDRDGALASILAAADRMTAWDAENADLASVLAAIGEDTQAAAYKRRVDVRSRADYSKYELKARPFERSNDWQATLEIWTEAAALRVDPIRTAVPHHRALFRLERYAEALSALAPALEIAAPSVEVLKMAGHCLNKLGDKPAAAGYYRQAVNAAPTDQASLRFLGQALLSIGECEEALLHARTAASLDPTEANLAFVRKVQARLGVAG